MNGSGFLPHRLPSWLQHRSIEGSNPLSGPFRRCARNHLRTPIPVGLFQEIQDRMIPSLDARHRSTAGLSPLTDISMASSVTLAFSPYWRRCRSYSGPGGPDFSWPFPAGSVSWHTETFPVQAARERCSNCQATRRRRPHRRFPWHRSDPTGPGTNRLPPRPYRLPPRPWGRRALHRECRNSPCCRERSAGTGTRRPHGNNRRPRL